LKALLLFLCDCHINLVPEQERKKKEKKLLLQIKANFCFNLCWQSNEMIFVRKERKKVRKKERKKERKKN
jgi:hypothetical protein